MQPRRGITLETIALIVFAASLVMPALVVEDKPLFGGDTHAKILFGIHCLIYGWLVLPGWLANPLLLTAAILHKFRRHRLAIVFASLAVVSAAIGPLMMRQFADMRLLYPHVGYVAWCASIVAVLAAAARAAWRGNCESLTPQ